MHVYIVGAGSIGKRHYNNFKTLGYKVTLIRWRDFEMLRLRDALKMETKPLLVIATSTQIRLPIIQIGIDLNIPMYIEKPLSFERSELDLIYTMPIDLQKKSFLGFMMRYHPVIMLIHSLIRKKSFTGSIHVGQDINSWRSDWSFRRSYASKEDGGGVLLDLSHELDLAMIFNPTLKLTKVVSNAHKDFPNIDFETMVYFQTNLQEVFKVQLDYTSKIPHRGGKLSSDGTIIEYNLLTNKMIFTESKSKKFSFKCERNDLFINAIKDFILLANEKKPKNELAPSLFDVRDSSYLISDAWNNRNFLSTIEMELS